MRQLVLLDNNYSNKEFVAPDSRLLR